jgi:hypothetical protein
VGADESDKNDACIVVNFGDEPEVVSGDIENDSVAG